MSKRILAAVLWFLTGWYVGAFIAFLVGVPDILGPVMGTAFAAIIAGDPMHMIWGPARQADKTRAVAKARLEELPSLH